MILQEMIENARDSITWRAELTGLRALGAAGGELHAEVRDAAGRNRGMVDGVKVHVEDKEMLRTLYPAEG